MGQANRAPKSHYGRKLHISQHATQRFRERVEEEFAARPDADLANLLDERVGHSKDRREVIDTNYNGTVSTVIGFESRKGETSYALLRENTVITVMTPDMVEGSFRSGAWTVPMNTPFAAALAGAKPYVPQPGVDVPKAQIRLKPKAGALKADGTPYEPPSVDDPVVRAGLALALAARDVAVCKKRYTELADAALAADVEQINAKQRLEIAEAALHEAIKTATTAFKEP